MKLAVNLGVAVLAFLGAGWVIALAPAPWWPALAAFTGGSILAVWLWMVGPPRPWVTPVVLLGVLVCMFLLYQHRAEVGSAAALLLCGLVFGSNLGVVLRPWWKAKTATNAPSS